MENVGKNVLFLTKGHIYDELDHDIIIKKRALDVKARAQRL